VRCHGARAVKLSRPILSALLVCAAASASACRSRSQIVRHGDRPPHVAERGAAEFRIRHSAEDSVCPLNTPVFADYLTDTVFQSRTAVVPDSLSLFGASPASNQAVSATLAAALTSPATTRSSIHIVGALARRRRSSTRGPVEFSLAKKQPGAQTFDPIADSSLRIPSTQGGVTIRAADIVGLSTTCGMVFSWTAFGNVNDRDDKRASRAVILLRVSALVPALVAVAAQAFAQQTCARQTLQRASAGVLIACLSHTGVGWLDDRWVIHDELVRRAPVDTLIAAFGRAADDAQRATLLQVLYHIDDKQIDSALRGCATPGATEEAYYCLNYLAKRGDTTALRLLNDHYYEYPISSLQWSYTVALFGKFQYRRATENLLESVDAASGNVGGAAVEALLELYPGAPRDFASAEEAKEKLRRYLDRIGATHPR